MNNMTDNNTFGIYKINQLLFLEAGFVHLNTILSGVFIPIYGLTFFFVSIATYFVYCFMAVIVSRFDNEFEDIYNVTSSSDFPSAGKNMLVVLGLIVATVPIVIFYNQELIVYPHNSVLCTLFASLIGGLAYTLVNSSKSIVAILLITIFSIPLVFVSLVIGAVITLPLLFIFFYRRQINAN